MRVLNKSSSVPIMSHRVPETTSSAKPRKRRLQELQNQVNKSRIAIENMTQTRAIESSLYSQVEDLQKELHRCIVSLNHESEKEKVLSKLVTVLKGEMNAVQAVQRTSEEFVSCGIQKKIKKVEYDIKQILHKYNEEIAKINWLKEQANAARDQRVVYSNLFNKIEKEIKHYEEIYKQTLIKNEIFLDKKRGKSLKHAQEALNTDLIDEKPQRIDFKDRKQSNSNSSKKDLKSKQHNKSIKYTDRTNNIDVEAFITNPRETMTKIIQQPNKCDTVTSPSKYIPQHRGIEAEIRQKEAAIESIIVHAQCRSQNDVLRVYSSIDSQNQQLIIEISQLDQHIGYLQDQIDRLKRQKRSSQIYENRQLSEMVNISRNCRSNKTAIAQHVSSSTHYQQKITKNLCDLLGIQSENLCDDILREVDQRIEELGCCGIRLEEKRESRMAGEDVSERGVVELLEKIDRFGESDKIFDRNMLRAEYQKQMSKVKKRGKKTN